MPNTSNVEHPNAPSPKPQPRRLHKPNALAQFVHPPDFYDDQAVPDARDEYKKYLSTPARRCDNPLKWWKAHRQKYPRLSRMALNFILSL